MFREGGCGGWPVFREGGRGGWPVFREGGYGGWPTARKDGGVGCLRESGGVVSNLSAGRDFGLGVLGFT